MNKQHPIGPAQRAGGHTATHLSDYLRVLSRRRWTACLAFVVVFMYGAFSTLKKTPIYEATAQLLVEGEARRATSLNTVLDQQDGSFDDEFYQTQYRMLQSRDLGKRAVQTLGAQSGTTDPTATQPATETRSWSDSAIAWLSSVAGAPKRIEPPKADETTLQSRQIDAFLAGLAVAPTKGTHLVQVSYRSADPVMAAKAANAVVDQYIQYTLQQRLDSSQETTSYLGKQLDEQRQKVEAADEAVQRYKEHNDAVALDDKQNTVVQKLADLNGSLTKAQSERIEKEALYRRVEQLPPSAPELDTIPAVMSNDLVQKLRGDLADLRQKRATMLLRFTEKNSEVVNVDSQIRVTEAKLQDQIAKVVTGLKNEFLMAQTRERDFAQALEAQKQAALGLNRKGIEYSNLVRESTSSHQIYDDLLRRAKEAGVTGGFKGSNIHIVDRAETPREPVLPRTSRELMMSALLGCFLAVGLVFGFEYLDSRIKTPDDIKNYLGLAFLGIVPTISKKEGDDPLLPSSDLPPAFGEAMRAIRTSVVFSSADEGARTIVITSSAPHEGKTLVSTNLACALAQADQRTLIIDGDMRRARVHEVFNRQLEPGLSNVLVGTAPLRDAIRATSVPNLFVLPAGHVPPNPAELLGSNKYIELMDDLQHQFDWIIVDAPPVLAVTDAAIIAHGATGVLFVVGAEMTPRRNAISAIEQLTAAKAKFIGAVLNRVDIQRHAYYYSPYYRKDYTKAYVKSSR